MSSQIAMPNITAAASTTIFFTPGTCYTKPSGELYQFCDGGGTIAQNEYVFITKDGLFTITSLTTTNVANAKVQFIGAAQITGLTSTTFGWIFRGYGAHTGKFAASCAQDVRVSPTAVAGVVDDAASQSCIVGLSLLTTIVGAAASPAWASGLLVTDGSST